jgi:hypothetical protein
MKIKQITEADIPKNFETNPAYKKLANIGRALMTHSETASMKGKDDNAIRMYNQMSALGNTLTKFGTVFGPKNVKDVMDETDLDAAAIKALMAFGEKLAAKGVAPKVADVEPDAPEDDEFAAPDDDEIARQADARAAKRK